MEATLPPLPVPETVPAPRSPRLALWAKLVVLGALAYAAASPFFFHFIAATFAKAGKPLPLPLAAIVVLQGLQTCGIVALAAWGFVALGPRLGLDAPVLRGKRRLREVLVPGLLAGTVATLAAVGIEQAFRPFVPAKLHEAGTGAAMGGPLLGLSASFYGGVIEETLMRLGVMTLLAFALTMSRPRTECEASARRQSR